MEDRIALEELYRWARDGGSRRSVTMVGPDAEFGWLLALQDGSKRRTGRARSFAELAGKLLEEMK